MLFLVVVIFKGFILSTRYRPVNKPASKIIAGSVVAKAVCIQERKKKKSLFIERSD